MAVPNVTKIRTEAGDALIDYKALANAPQIDKLLMSPGQIADAQAVGNKFDEVYIDLGALETTFSKNLNDLGTKLDDSVNLINKKLDEKLDKIGGKMESPIDMGGLSITNVKEPVNDGDAANKAYVDQNITLAVSSKAETDAYLATLLVDGWVGDVAPYVQSITVDGVLSTDNPFVDVHLSDDIDYVSVMENWMYVGRATVTEDNTIVAYCYEDKPEVDIPIILKVVR